MPIETTYPEHIRDKKHISNLKVNPSIKLGSTSESKFASKGIHNAVGRNWE